MIKVGGGLADRMRGTMKKSRHQKIKELIEQYEIETQEELADKLR